MSNLHPAEAAQRRALELVCQDCGQTVRRLTDAEAAQVAARPYDFVVYCGTCVTAYCASCGAPRDEGACCCVDSDSDHRKERE